MIEFLRPNNISGVSQILADQGTAVRIIAGGTDLLIEARLKENLLSGLLVDISRIDEVNQIKETGNQIEIGAAVTHDRIVRNPLIEQYAPVLSGACRQIGSQQIRNRGTIGGNICNASPCADSIPALFVLGARLVVSSGEEDREVSIETFFIRPYHTVLKPGEWITKIIVPKLNQNQQSAFIKLGRRNALAISRMNMAAVLELAGGKIINSRFTPGSVFPVWQRVAEIEHLLNGQNVSLELFEKAGRITAAKMIEISGRRWSAPYKEPVVAALTKRALCKAAGLEYPEINIQQVGG